MPRATGSRPHSVTFASREMGEEFGAGVTVEFSGPASQSMTDRVKFYRRRPPSCAGPGTATPYPCQLRRPARSDPSGESKSTTSVGEDGDFCGPAPEGSSGTLRAARRLYVISARSFAARRAAARFSNLDAIDISIWREVS